jgi:biopolymer transport protein TolR
VTSGYRRRSPLAADVKPDINVTPLVDVVLVLLIIFMVVAPRLDQDVQVEVPGIYNADPEKQLPTEPFKVTLPQAGEFHVGQQRYDLDGVIEYLSGEHALDPNRRLVLRADARLSYKDVRLFLAKTQDLGFPGLSFTVGERHRAGASNAAQQPSNSGAEAPQTNGQPAAPADAGATTSG